MLLMVVAGWLGDAEAAVVGVVLVVGAALLRWRRGLLGVLILTGMLANVAFWMTAGVVSNLAADESFVDRAVPATLTVIALTGVLAGLVQLVRRNRSGGSAGAVAAVGGLGALALVALLVLSLVGGRGEGVADTDVELASAGLAFEPEELSVQAGEVTVVMRNEDLFWHTFTVDELGVDLRVPVRGERAATFDAPPGTYRFYCRIPGHPEAGMVGTLEVT